MVNDSIPEQLCMVRYTLFDQAVKVVCSKMAKCDIKSAFLLLPMHPKDFKLLRFCFEGQIYMERALLMGCFVSCAVFEAFSSFLDWALGQWVRCGGIAHYLDNFLFVGAHGTGHCRALMVAF